MLLEEIFLKDENLYLVATKKYQNRKKKLLFELGTFDVLTTLPQIWNQTNKPKMKSLA